jgi:lipoprotein-releasing system permease protein
LNLELFIARRVHFSKSSGDRQVTPPAVRIATAGVALAVATMLLSVAIVTGFKKEVRNKVIGFDSHIRITNFDSNHSYETTPMQVNDTLLATLRLFPGVRHVQPFATKPGLLKTKTDFQGIVLKGVDETFDWRFFRDHLQEGELFTIDPTRMSTEVLISRSLANMLGLKCGDSILSYFVQDEIRARKWCICGIYNTSYEDYDRLFVLADLKQVCRLNGWEAGTVGGLEVFVEDYDRLDEITEQLQIYFYPSEKTDAQGNAYYARSIKELNPMIFNWLDVLDLNVGIIMALMMAVAGITMISGLLIIILERTRMIGILKALGQSNRSLRRVFLHISFFLIGKGMIWGNVIGVAICFIQSRYHILSLDPANYYLDTVPVELNFIFWLLINLGALTVSMLMMLVPSCLISRISPARTIRFE